MNKLFVGGLSWNTSEDGMRVAFESFGEVLEARVITDRETGRSRGFGFITLDSAEAAKRAQEQMDGAMLDGRAIRVSEATERAPRGGGGRGRY